VAESELGDAQFYRLSGSTAMLSARVPVLSSGTVRPIRIRPLKQSFTISTAAPARPFLTRRGTPSRLHLAYALPTPR
jgi:hypothetical protein